MLRVYIHSGLMNERNPGNLLATLDIAYRKQAAWSDYTVGFFLKGTGEVQADAVLDYPRWSASLWDLVARALTRILYRADEAPALPEPDRRCAYATKLCAFIEKSTTSERGIELGSVEISQVGKQRGVYTAVFKEDILGGRGASFAYGLKSLVPADLLLRAICWAYFDQEGLGERPALVVPASIEVDKVKVFDANGLPEPSKTGFRRYRGGNFPTAKAPESMAKLDDYTQFMERG
jgi:hypothetical protein